MTTDLKIFIHKGNGHYIGSSVTVLATDMEEAAIMIRKELDENGLKDEAISITRVVPLDKAKVVDVINGDY